jgi:predicted nucleic acid-binding protein
MRVLFDTDVLLDLFLDRPGFAENANALWDADQQGK